MSRASTLGPLPIRRPRPSSSSSARVPSSPTSSRPAENADVGRSPSAAALDGVPLALELAAARVRVFTPAVILARLDHVLPLLVGGAAGSPRTSAHPPGHDRVECSAAATRRTPSYSCAWACSEAASPSTRSSGCPTGGDGADAVRRRSPRSSTGSLVREQDRGARAWFTMLATVREYAREQLELEGACWASARSGTRRFYLRLAADAGRAAESPRARVEWMSAPRRRTRRTACRGRPPHRVRAEWDDVVGLIWPLLLVLVGRRPARRGRGRGCTRLLEPDVELTHRSRTIVVFLSSSISLQSAPDPNVIPVLTDCVERFQQEGDEFGQALAFACSASPTSPNRSPTSTRRRTCWNARSSSSSSVDNPFMRATIGIVLGGRSSCAAMSPPPSGSSMRTWPWHDATTTSSASRSRSTPSAGPDC